MRGLIFVTMIAFLVTGCKNECDQKNGSTLVRNGDLAPLFEITDMSGTKSFNSTTTGKKVLIYFLWSECPDCHKTTPNVMELWRKIHNNPQVELLCIARGGGKDATAEMALSYWQKVALSIAPIQAPAIYYDRDRLCYNKFASSNVPRFYLIDSKGIIRWQSDTNNLPEQLFSIINAID